VNVLVTGAAGFIGSHLTERLLDSGARVVGLDVFDEFYDPSIKEANLSRSRQYDGFVELRADIRDPDLLAKLPDDIEIIVHLAARAGVRPSIQQPGLYTSVNVSGTLALLEFARERGIERFVFGSSSSVYGEAPKVPFVEDDVVDRPISPYAATKRAGELLCHTFHHLYGLRVAALRFFTVYGPRQRPDLAIHKFARLMIENRPLPVFGDGSTARDYTYIDDIVDGVVRAMAFLDRHPSAYEIINLGESTTVSLNEMIRVLSEAIGVDPRIQFLPAQAGDVTRTWASVAKAQRLLQYSPRTEFAAGIERFAAWFRERNGESGPRT
jgi:UDP-glucuronate 4-epimerase